MTLTVAASSNPAVWQQPVTFTAVVDPGATGTITFHYYSANSTPLGPPVALSGSQAQITPPFLPVGTWPIVAVYSGDSNFAPTASAPLNLEVDPALSTIAITKPTPGANIVAGQDLGIQASVAVLTPYAGRATGVVDFMDNGNVFASAPVVPGNGPGTGAASAQLISLPAGPHLLSARLEDFKDSSGNVAIRSSISTAVSIVLKLPCSVNLTALANSIRLGQSASFTANVLRGGPDATGNITFLDAVNFPSGMSLPITANQTQLVVSNLRVGKHTLLASYDGDANFIAATSNPLALTVNPLYTVTTLISPSASDNWGAGQTVTFSAKVQSEVAAVAAIGSVQFLDAGVPIASATFAGGVASASFANLATGQHYFSARYIPGPDYQGDINFVGSDSALQPMVIVDNRTPTSLTVVSGPASPVYGQNLTLTAQINSQAANAPAPASGQVQFQESGVTLGTVSVTDGAAALSLSSLSAGAHQIQVLYSGDSQWRSASATAPVVVGRATPSATLQASISSSGEPLLTAQVSSSSPASGSPASGIPTGAVQFKDVTSGAVLASVTLVNGAASERVGADQIMRPFVAVYSGDNNFASGTSAPSLSVVNVASYDATRIASGGMAAVFGIDLPSGDVVATDPSATSLNDVTVTIADQMGNSWPVPLYGVFASSRQINFRLPPDIAPGLAMLTITTPSSSNAASGVINVTSIAPGIFTANGSGHGVAAGSFVHVFPDGSQTSGSVAAYQSPGNLWTPQPIDLGGPNDQDFLVLYGTGLRNAANGSVSVSGNGINLPLQYAGAQPTYAGLDQVNVQLPHSLAGAGTVTVTVTVESQAANPVTIFIQ